MTMLSAVAGVSVTRASGTNGGGTPPAYDAPPGFFARRVLGDGRELAVWVGRDVATLFVGESGARTYDDGWEYHDAGLAVDELWHWDPETELEPAGWSRHPRTGRRRLGGDPDLETMPDVPAGPGVTGT